MFGIAAGGCGGSFFYGARLHDYKSVVKRASVNKQAVRLVALADRQVIAAKAAGVDEEKLHAVIAEWPHVYWAHSLQFDRDGERRDILQARVLTGNCLKGSQNGIRRMKRRSSFTKNCSLTSAIHWLRGTGSPKSCCRQAHSWRLTIVAPRPNSSAA
jgi:hypothetical protein